MIARRGAAAIVVALAVGTPHLAGEASAAGSYVFLEGQLGYGIGHSFTEDPDGFSGKLTLGAGGKWRDFPTRFYVIGNLSFAALSGETTRGLQRAETDRDWLAWTFGVRTLTPLAPNARLLVDLAIGEARVSSHATVNRVERYEVDDTSLLIEAALGFQYRLIPALSLGARVEIAIPTSFDQVDEIAALIGSPGADAGGVNPSFLLTITWHL